MSALDRPWRLRDADRIRVPRGYALQWDPADPFGRPPAITRAGVAIGLEGLFLRIDLGDAAAARCLIALLARALAKWPEGSTARARRHEPLPHRRAHLCLVMLLNETQLGSERASDLDPQRIGEEGLDRELLAEDFRAGVSHLLIRASRIERARSQADRASRAALREPPVPSADEVWTAWVEAVDDRARYARVAQGLTELNRALLPSPSCPLARSALGSGALGGGALGGGAPGSGALGGGALGGGALGGGAPGSGALGSGLPGSGALDLDDMRHLLEEAGDRERPGHEARLASWLSPPRVHLRVACFVLCTVAQVPAADAHRMLVGAGYRTARGTPPRKNSVASFASGMKDELQRWLAGAKGGSDGRDPMDRARS